jgi:predicted ATPase with chaperone activity
MAPSQAELTFAVCTLERMRHMACARHPWRGLYGPRLHVGCRGRPHPFTGRHSGRLCRCPDHHLLRLDPGGSQPRLARRLTTILPAMTLAEAIETTRIHSVAGLTGDRTALVTTRPCRAPHHTISDAGLIGGGHVPMPGEVSLAHNGVLFLDEWPEFRRHVLEVLRQPLEESLTRIYFRGRLES